MTAIAIVGMHRSGTSLVAHLLHDSGLWLGPEQELMPAAPDNLDGFWENVRIVSLNGALLNSLGTDWDCPVPVPSDLSPLVVSHRATAEELAASIAGGGDWGFKDPRASLLLSFWRAAIPGLRVLLCVRHPLEVAVSLFRRNNHSYSHTIRLWQIYNEAVLAATEPSMRAVVHYGSVLDDPARELARVARVLGLNLPAEGLAAAAAAARTELRHSRFTPDELAMAGAPRAAGQLYANLCLEAGREAEANAVLAAYSDTGTTRRELPPELDVRMLELARLREDLRLARAQVAKRDQTVQEVKAVLESERREAANRDSALAAALDAGRQAVQQVVEESLAALQPQLAEQAHELQLLLAAAAEAGRSTVIQAAQEAIAVVQPQLAEQTRELQRLRVEFARRDVELHERLNDLQAASDPGAAERLRDRRASTAFCEAVAAATPESARILVVTHGDEAVLHIRHRAAEHFPKDASGAYAGYHPASSLAAIAQLEANRYSSASATYLAIPEPQLWWLDHYDALARHLDRRCTLVHRSTTAAVYLLGRNAGVAQGHWPAQMDDVLSALAARFNRDANVLDWDSGLDVARHFPEAAVFSAPGLNARKLPYAGTSIDAVVLGAGDAERLAEARRVATGAVMLAHTDGSLDVHWMDGNGSVLPSISIVMPTYNGIEFIEACLRSLMETVPETLQVEFVVVDARSTDAALQRLAAVAEREPRLRIIRTKVRPGFIAEANRGCVESHGEIVLLLNNDTIALPGWLPPILRIFQRDPKAGAVGGKLIFPDGRLKEAGGVVFSNGRAASFGDGEFDPSDALFDYVRDVDYVCAAHLAFRRSILEEVGGFDERHRTAYYEDICFKVRELGYKVYYQPQSAIVDVQCGPSRVNEAAAAGRHQKINRAVFQERWADALRRQPTHPSRFDLASLHTLAVREAR